jgi:MYXO-CTERM domain-containing protein
MIVNSGGGIIAESITLATACSSGDGCAPDMAVARPADSSGCKCDVGGTPSPAPYGLLLLVGVAVVIRRRRA